MQNTKNKMHVCPLIAAGMSSLTNINTTDKELVLSQVLEAVVGVAVVGVVWCHLRVMAVLAEEAQQLHASQPCVWH